MTEVRACEGVWAEVLDPFVDVMYERGWDEGLSAIETVNPAAIGGALGRYISYDGCILMNREYDGDHAARILLHEVGHHLHYRKVLGEPPREQLSRQQWDTFCEWKLPSEEAVEYVAWEFARYHEGNLGEEWDADVYERLHGPRLTNPLIESLKCSPE